MDISFPFPSLKNLAMIRIAKVMLENVVFTRGFCHLDHLLRSWGQVNEIVTPLQLPATIKHDLADVITGMFRQLGHILPFVEDVLNLDDMELLCDQNGRLDAAFWRRNFERHVANYSTMDGLLHLLDRTIELELFSGIDAIFSRMMPLLGLNADSLEKGTLYMDDDVGHIMVYRPRNISADAFTDLTNFLCCQMRIRHEMRYRHRIRLRTEGAIEISAFSVSHLDYADMKDYLESGQHPMNPQNLYDFICEYNLLHAMDIFTTMNPEMQRECLVIICREDDFVLLEIFLIWPFTQVFMRFLEFAGPNITTSHHILTFIAIVGRIPARGLYGVVYAHLLEKYWDAIPPDVKQDIRARLAAGANEDDNDNREEDIVSFEEALNRLSETNTYLHEKISND